MAAYDFSIVTDTEQQKQLFGLTREYGLLMRTFYGGIWREGQFIDLMKSAHLYVVMYEQEVVGYSWVNMFNGRSAVLHVCLFPSAPRGRRIEMGKAFLKYLLFSKDENGEYYRDSLVGLVPETHRHVEIFGLSIGMNHIGCIPAGVNIMGEAVDLAILTVTREDLMEG